MQAHDRMASAWAGRSDFGPVPDDLARVIADHGDQGRGDVSDLLSRLHQQDPDSAAHLQQAVAQAGGGRVPFADGSEPQRSYSEGELLTWKNNVERQMGAKLEDVADKASSQLPEDKS